MNPKLRKPLEEIESTLSNRHVVSVPWYVYGISFMPMIGESWEELQERVTRWLNSEEVPGPYGEMGHKKDSRTRRVSLLSLENLETTGELLTKTINIGDTDSSGIRYVEDPAPRRLAKLIDQRIKDVLNSDNR